MVARRFPKAKVATLVGGGEFLGHIERSRVREGPLHVPLKPLAKVRGLCDVVVDDCLVMRPSA